MTKVIFFSIIEELERENSMKIATYKNLNIGKTEAPRVQDDEIDGFLDSIIAKITRSEAKEGKAEDGDVCNIDFEGFANGVAFEGGKGEKYDLELGSHTFIPGFEDQLIGHEKGDKVDVKVTFPENYPAEELAGQEAIFKCVVNEVKKLIVPTIDDDFAQHFGFENVAKMRIAIASDIQDEKDAKAKGDYMDKLTEEILSKSEIEYSDVEVEKTTAEMTAYFKQSIKQQGIEYDQYLQMVGVSNAQFEEMTRKQAIQYVKMNNLYEELAKLENITATEEQVNDQLERLRGQYQMNDEQFEKFKKDHINEVEETVVRYNVSNFLFENNK